MIDVNYGTWATPESPLTVQYSLVVIEEIRQEVAQGFQRMARGGIEVGGVLYGRRDGRTISVTAVRPIACEHALGPSFQLSGNDRAALDEQLAHDAEDSQLEGMTCVGLYLSHTRSEISLSDSDLDLYNTYFGAPWQVAMVVRPGRAGAMRAGFFIREPEGAVQTQQSYLEFNFPDRLAGVLERPKPERERERRPAPMPRSEGSAAPALVAAPREQPQQYSEPSFALLDRSVPEGPHKSKWPWLLAWALVLVVLVVFGLRYFLLRTVSEPIALTVLEREGQLQIGWNHSARPITEAIRGSLEISDGGASKRIALTAAELGRGNFTYQRQSGDVEVRMIVEDQGGDKVQEASRFLGRGPQQQAGDDPALKDLESKRAEIEAENQRLRQENAQQAQRIQQLETTIKIMQTRKAAE
jgi:proteasome lid subunit RPN8/RPN11